eukprot:25916_1
MLPSRVFNRSATLLKDHRDLVEFFLAFAPCLGIHVAVVVSIMYTTMVLSTDVDNALIAFLITQIVLVWFSVGYLYDTMERKASAWNSAVCRWVLTWYEHQLLREQVRERQVIRRVLSEERRACSDLAPIILNYASSEALD